MKQSTTKWKKWIGCLICFAFISFALPAVSKAGEALPVSEPLYIMGTVHREGDRILLRNIHGIEFTGELVLNISEETRILDAVNGFPVSANALKEGETVYAYISQAMALSLPPQSHAVTIICQIPAGFTAPRYETIKSFTQLSDKTYRLSTVHGNQYTVNDSTTLLPYLTRNMVYLSDLTEGRTCLIWGAATPSTPDQAVDAGKIVLFSGFSASDSQSSGPSRDPSLTDRVPLS